MKTVHYRGITHYILSDEPLLQNTFCGQHTLYMYSGETNRKCRECFSIADRINEIELRIKALSNAELFEETLEVVGFAWDEQAKNEDGIIAKIYVSALKRRLEEAGWLDNE